MNSLMLSKQSRLNGVVSTDTLKYLLFGGKGGVGKTTMAASTALWLADIGRFTLIVSTDPTISLSAIFQQEISHTVPSVVPGVQHLQALNINPKTAAGPYQQRLNDTVAKFTSLFGKDVVNTPCMEEMAAFDQFVRFLNDTTYDVIVFDTAPTGHTLRELAMPFDWANFLANQITSRKELAALLAPETSEDMLEDLHREKKRYDNALDSLRNDRTTVFIMVLLPEKLPIEETSRAIQNLGELGIPVQSLVVNEVIHPNVLQGNWFLTKRRETQDKYLSTINQRFAGQTVIQVPLFETDIVGIEDLRKVGRLLYDN